MSDRSAPASTRDPPEAQAIPRPTFKQRLIAIIVGRPAGKKPPETVGLFISENLEAFIYAVVLVVIVRHFAITPFVIPSASMEPTLMGHENVNDRLFVNPWVYAVEPIERWDVVVFLYPLNRDKHFIKRLVGMGDEEIAIAAGDVYIGGKIARKAAAAQKSMWIDVSRIDGPRELARWGTRGAELGLKGDLALTPPDASTPASLRFLNPRISYDRPTPNGPVPIIPDKTRDQFVGDLQLGAKLDAPSAGTVELRLERGADVLRCELPVGTRGRFVHERRTTANDVETIEVVHEQALDLVLEAGARGKSVRYTHVDRQLTLEVDGWSFSYDLDAAHPRDLGQVHRDGLESAAAAEIRCSGGTLGLHAVSLERDVYYTNEGVLRIGNDGEPLTFRIPKDRYFMLGDNSPNSSDSRLWTIRKVVSTSKADGSQRTVIGETDGSSRGSTMRLLDPSGTRVAYLDEYGVWQEFDQREVDLEVTEMGWSQPDGVDPNYQTVGRELVVGRAFLVFWPLRPFRLKLIR